MHTAHLPSCGLCKNVAPTRSLRTPRLVTVHAIHSSCFRSGVQPPSRLRQGSCVSPIRPVPFPSSAGSLQAASSTASVAPQNDAVAKDPWQHMLELQASGQPVDCVIQNYNKGGVLVSVEGLKGFIPFSKLDKSRLKAGHQGNLDYLIGQTVSAAVIQVDIQSVRKEVVLSEVQASNAETLRKLQPGTVVTATVTRLQDYGAFVTVQPEDGGRPVQGLVHSSELSWRKVMSVNSVLSVGQVVNLLVTDSDPVKGRLSLSLKRLERDPLKQNIDSIIPSGDDVAWQEPISAPLQLRPIVEQLKSIEGVEDVALGRQATVASTVVPELQVFLSREEREDGIVVVTRAGSMLQELRLITSLSRDQVKKSLQAFMAPKAAPAPPAAPAAVNEPSA